MLEKNEFVDMLLTSYRNLYDLVRLRTDPLGLLIFSDATLEQKERAWKLHRLLLEMIDELKPTPQSPLTSREARRYRLMHLRYIEALDPQTVAKQLAITRRHYYREHTTAIEAIAAILWERYFKTCDTLTTHIQSQTVGNGEHIQLVKQEALRLTQTPEMAHLPVIITDVIELVKPMLQQRNINIVTSFAELPPVMVNRGSLRQVMLGLFSFIVDYIESATLRLSILAGSTRIIVDVLGESHNLFDVVETQLNELNALATLSGIVIEPRDTLHHIRGFSIDITPPKSKTILVVDDNEDMLLLYQTYLSSHNYQVLLANNAKLALEYTLKTLPDYILLDLMMPDQDGWDVLQRFKNQPHTQHIPIIICSVLKQRNLALALGASAFIEKPVTEKTLVATLDQLA